MRRKLITAIPPDEILKIKEISRAKVEIKIREAEAYFGMPRWEIIIDGSNEEIEKFMNVLMKSRAGG
ncbi:TIGR04140 family protein [Thermococcus sp. 2319x1]|uniref:TIGR04140 family protein n=1 Tax=Thermococcus sp. 2319x1 TaxID=1674923 RepID=UPI001581B4A3|nr:TIGR04140 family protein [Thermococcus sp. 2319x1]